MASMIEKQNWILETIRRNRRLTLEEIASKWADSSLNSTQQPLSYRTFNRQVNAIRCFYGVTIKCDKRTNEYYIENSAEAEGGEIQNWLLDAIATGNLAREYQSMNHRIIYEHVPSGHDYVDMIVAAMQTSNIIEMKYQSYWEAEARTFTIEPYFVKMYKQRWYLIGIPSTHPGKIRCYGLDRVQDMKILEDKFKFPERFNAKDYCYNSYGIFLSEDRPQIVRLKATGNQQAFLRSLPLHHSQKEVETGVDYAIFEYYLSPQYDFVKELLSREATIEVLEPDSLRQQMKETIENMLNNYR